jgi:hypothetical protein
MIALILSGIVFGATVVFYFHSTEGGGIARVERAIADADYRMAQRQQVKQETDQKKKSENQLLKEEVAALRAQNEELIRERGQRGFYR